MIRRFYDTANMSKIGSAPYTWCFDTQSGKAWWEYRGKYSGVSLLSLGTVQDYGWIEVGSNYAGLEVSEGM